MRPPARIAALCVAAVLPSLAVQAWQELQLRSARAAEVRESGIILARHVAEDVEHIVEGARQMLVAVAEAEHGAVEGAACARRLGAVRLSLPRYHQIALLDASGRVLCSSDAGAEESLPDLQGVLADALALREFRIGGFARTDGGPVLSLAQPMPGNPPRVAVATLDLAWLSAHLGRHATLLDAAVVTVTDRGGTVLARSRDPGPALGHPGPEPLVRLAPDAEVATLDVAADEGERRVVAHAPVGNGTSGLSLVVEFTADAAYRAIDDATRRAIALIVAGFLSAIAAAWLFGRLYLRDPLDRLLETMRRWREGDRATRAIGVEGWEIGRLAAGFNAMAEAVEARELALRQGEARLRAVLEQMPTGVILASIPRGEVLFRNARATALIGGVAGEEAELLRGTLDRLLRRREPTEALELPLRRADGTKHWVSVSAAPVETAGGQPLAVLTLLDIEGRKHAERQQELLTAELRHRVKNALAVVQAVASQTLARSASLDEFRASFMGRLGDLARAQDALFASEDGRVRLDWLVRTALAPFCASAVETSGPEVALPARQTLAMALVLHELATNAAKHGALRPGGEGRLRVLWRLQPMTGQEAEVILHWQESGIGGEARLRAGKGFGARLITRCIAHDLRGEAQCRTESDGLSWQIAFPVPEGARIRNAETEAA